MKRRNNHYQDAARTNSIHVANAYSLQHPPAEIPAAIVFFLKRPNKATWRAPNGLRHFGMSVSESIPGPDCFTLSAWTEDGGKLSSEPNARWAARMWSRNSLSELYQALHWLQVIRAICGCAMLALLLPVTAHDQGRSRN